MGQPRDEARMRAREMGHKKYTPEHNRPCIHGHPPLRYTVNGRCVYCVQEAAHENHERLRAQTQAA